MPVPCRVSIDAGTPLSYSAGGLAATVLLQGTNGAGKPIRINRVGLQGNSTGSTQNPVLIQLGFYATGTSTGGAARTAVPVDEGLTGVYTPATAFYTNTPTLGTTFTFKRSFEWNTCNPWDDVSGLSALQWEIPAGKVWALLIPAVTLTYAFSLTGDVWFEEFG